MLEVGNFIRYNDKYTMAIVGETNGVFYALCNENHKVAKISGDDPKAVVLKKKGCPSIVKAIYDDMKLAR